MSVFMYVPSRVPPIKCLFAFLDFLGKSYVKEVVSDLVILTQKWSKIAAQKKVNFGLFFKYHLTFYILQVR